MHRGCSADLAACFAEAVESEKLAFVVLVIAEDARHGDFAAFDQFGQANQLAELGFEVESVALVCDKVHIAFAGVQHSEELCDVNVMQIHDGFHVSLPPFV